jgi:cytochrome P450 family 135
MRQTISTPAVAHTMPPGPRWPRVAQTLMWGANPVGFARYCQRRHGDVFTLRTLAIGDVVAVANPAIIKEVFAADGDVFRAGQANAILGPVLGRHSLLLLDGERHLSQRRMMLPPFHGEAIRGYELLIEEIAAAEVERWPVGEELELRPRMQAIALEVILRAVIGVRDQRRLERLRGVLPALLGIGLSTMWAMWAKPRLANGPFARMTALRHRAEVDRLLYEEIAAHRAHPAGRDDILATLIAARDERDQPLSDEELRDQIVTLLLAGHETTTTGLAWCFERLLRNQACMERLRDEISGGGEHAYLEAVINETLRLRPVIDSVWRKLSAPADVAGYSLPAGTTVMPSIALVQSGAAFPDAEEFQPERMLDGSSPPYALIPFGGGPRRCVGASFAMMEMKIILRTVLGSCELRADRPRRERTRVRNITLVPARGARVVIRSKLAASPEAESTSPSPHHRAGDVSGRSGPAVTGI